MSIYGNEILKIGKNNELSLNRRLSSVSGIEWKLIDKYKPAIYSLNNRNEVIVTSTQYNTDTKLTIFESHLKIKSFYTKENGFCIDNNGINNWLLEQGRTYGFQLRVTGLDYFNNPIFWDSNIIYLKMKKLPTKLDDGYCKIVAPQSPKLLEPFNFECFRWQSNSLNNNKLLKYNIITDGILWNEKFVDDINQLQGKYYIFICNYMHFLT